MVNSGASPSTGVLIPVPCHSTTILSIMDLGGAVVPYYLSENQGWELQVAELHRALESAKRVCKPTALYVINPGNPTGRWVPLDRKYCKFGSCIFWIVECITCALHSGHVQTRESIQAVIQFVAEKKLFLLADEVDASSSGQALTIAQSGCVNQYVASHSPQVYQEYVYGEKDFVSYKKVLAEMGPPFSDTVELASFHSVSKGVMGE